jgi:hypothetical protein
MCVTLSLPLLSFFLLVFVDGSDLQASEEDQCGLLVKFQKQMGGNLWDNGCSSGWSPRNTTPDCCSWNRRTIECDANNKVVVLNMGGCGIQGQFVDGDSVFRIPTLQEFYLDNQGSAKGVYGPLPGVDVPLAKALTNFTAYKNSLSGPLEMFGSLTNLKQLDLHFNQYSGTLPAVWHLMTNLHYLSLANNQLQGSIPSSWTAFTQLGTLGLAYNSLTGSLAPLAAMKSLKIIFLRNNSFSGAVPPLPQNLGALYLDNNPNLTSVDSASICASAPADGWNKGGCEVDWPSTGAVNACCMHGNDWDWFAHDDDNAPAFPSCLRPCYPPSLCTNKSADLDAAECAAWTKMYDAMGGPNWQTCSENRLDPCWCERGGEPPVVVCDDSGEHITKMYVHPAPAISPHPLNHSLTSSAPFSPSSCPRPSVHPLPPVYCCRYPPAVGMTGTIPSEIGSLAKLTRL